jgi:integrase
MAIDHQCPPFGLLVGAMMASAGIRKNRNGTRYQVWWRLDDGTQGSKTFDSRALARDFKNELLAQAAANVWVDPRRGRLLFDDWADHWWRLWSASPRRSPKGMETTDSHLRCHLRPYFGRRQLRQITPSIVLRWQHELEGKLSHSGVMACRSILLRIMDAARKEHLIATNPVREVEAPKPRLDPDQVFGHQSRRTLTPEEFGHLLAACRPFYRDHFLIQVGTGLRSGELLGLRRRRVFPELGRIEVIEVRYEAGRFGRGFKAEPKSLASVRVVPMCDQVRQAIARQLVDGARPADLVLPGPGGSNGIPRGVRAPLSTTNLRRVYKAAVDSAAADLDHLDLRGPHDLRHTFATWLEEAAIPSRVIDELMGHAGGRRDRGASGSPMGRVYRETTPAMLARVTAALDERIGRALAVAAYLLRERPDSRAVDGGEGR